MFFFGIGIIHLLVEQQRNKYQGLAIGGGQRATPRLTSGEYANFACLPSPP